MKLMITVFCLPGTAFRDFQLTTCRQGEGLGQITAINLPQCCYTRTPDRLTRFVFIPLPCHPCPTLLSGQSVQRTNPNMCWRSTFCLEVTLHRRIYYLKQIAGVPLACESSARTG